MSLAGKNAVVTGGASGIGRGISLRLAREGANVAIFDLNLAGAENVADEIRVQGRKALACRVDVTNRAQIDAATLQTRKDLGPIHVLVNDAGIGNFIPLAEMTEAQWDQMIAIHLKGTFNCTKACVQDMIDAKWGRIVNLSSVSALGNRGQANYSTAKAGLQGFTKTLAIELGKFGVTANAIAPGFIQTDMTKATAERMGIPFDDFIKGAASQIPVARVGQPEDIAHLVSFFVSEGAGFVSGQVVYAAGGPKA
jgi:3-oxoacyl-[acyl-carrier protein] reductase